MQRMLEPLFLVLFAVASASGQAPATPQSADDRPRARAIGVAPGEFEPGKWNAITDVPGVQVGHVTLVEGDALHTGATAIAPHAGNLFQEKVPAAVVVGNGFGKLVGATQVEELGQLETPILLTNTLNVWEAAATLADAALSTAGNELVRSVNPVVGETNDGWLNDIRARPLTAAHFKQALATARIGPVAEGCVGAGVGTTTLGFKGGIGSSSRLMPESVGPYVLGVLVQTNYGGRLTIDGAPVWRELLLPEESDGPPPSKDGSCMIVVATDAPLDARLLKRLARRAFIGMGRTGASFSHGSGDYVIAFSTNESLRILADPKTASREVTILDDSRMTPMFEAVADATEEAIYNALLRATTTRGRDGHTSHALPVAQLKKALKKFGRPADGEE